MNLLKIEINTNRVFGLDILRAIAILFVVIEHSALLFSAEIKGFITHCVLDGVTIFFVLSGFLIGGILIKTIERETFTTKTLLTFWSRRWLRTLPAYFFILSLLILMYLVFKRNINIPETLKYYIFFQNFNTPQPGFFQEAWSLSIEEWFYLIVPSMLFVLISFFKIKNTKSILIIAFAIISTVLLIRITRYVNLPANYPNNVWDHLFRKQVITRLDSLMFGVIGAFLAFYKTKIWYKHKNILLIGGIFIMLTVSYSEQIFNFRYNDLFKYVFLFSIQSISVLMVLPYLSALKKCPTGFSIFFKITTYVSLISYSMYLINLSVIQYKVIESGSYFLLGKLNINPELPAITTIKYICFWLFTIIGSILLYKYIEVPFMKLRDRKKNNSANTKEE